MFQNLISVDGTLIQKKKTFIKLLSSKATRTLVSDTANPSLLHLRRHYWHTLQVSCCQNRAQEVTRGNALSYPPHASLFLTGAHFSPNLQERLNCHSYQNCTTFLGVRERYFGSHHGKILQEFQCVRRVRNQRRHTRFLDRRQNGSAARGLVLIQGGAGRCRFVFFCNFYPWICSFVRNVTDTQCTVLSP